MSDPVDDVPLNFYVDDVVVVLGADEAPDEVMVHLPNALPGQAGSQGVSPGWRGQSAPRAE